MYHWGLELSGSETYKLWPHREPVKEASEVGPQHSDR